MHIYTYHDVEGKGANMMDYNHHLWLRDNRSLDEAELLTNNFLDRMMTTVGAYLAMAFPATSASIYGRTTLIEKVRAPRLVLR